MVILLHAALSKALAGVTVKIAYTVFVKFAFTVVIAPTVAVYSLAALAVAEYISFSEVLFLFTNLRVKRNDKVVPTADTVAIWVAPDSEADVFRYSL